MNLKTKIGVVSMVSLNLSGVVAGSAIAAIAQSFPDTPISTVQLLTTLPGLGSLLVTLVAGQMAMKISKKTLSLLGIALITIGGLLPSVLHHSIGLMLLCSVVLGAGLGFVTTLNPMLVSEYFDGEERSSVMGMSTGATSLGGMILMALGGMLGANNWQHLYWVYGIGALVFLILLVCLPKDRPQLSQNGEQGAKPSFFKTLKETNSYTLVIYVAIFAMVVAYNAYMSNLSITIAEKGIGDTAIAGLVNAIGTVGGVLAGFGFAFIRKITKPNTLAFGYFSTALALLVTYFSTNVIMLCIGAILSGIGMVAVMASSPFLLSMLSKPHHIPVVMTVYAFINGLAGAIAPKIISGLGIAAGLPSLMFGGLMTLVVGAILLVLRFGKKAESGSLLQED